MGARFLEDGHVLPGHYTAFSNNTKMVTINSSLRRIILRRELERKVGNVKHMRLEVMRPKTKTI